MVQNLEAIRGGGGSIRVGATGTISALMTRELDSTKISIHSPTAKPNRTMTVSVDCGSSSAPKRPQQRNSSDEASSSSNNNNHIRRQKGYSKKTRQIPMLGSGDASSANGTPSRVKTEKRGNNLNIVEIVDVKCGNSDRAWGVPITSRLKKLGFSKLSQSIL